MLRLLAAALALAAPGAPSTVATAHGQVVGVAQSGGSVAWLTSGATGCTLTLRAGGASHTVRYADGCSPGAQDLALANATAAWGGYQEVRCSETYAEVHTGTASRTHLVQTIDGDCLGFGTSYQGLAGDGTSFYYALLDTKEPPTRNCGDVGHCHWQLQGGEILRIAGGKARRVPGLPAAALIAGAPGLLALVQPARAAVSSGKSFDWPRAATNGKVSIYDTKSGRVVASFAPRGTVRAVAVSPTRAVVLVQAGSAWRLEWYDARSGARLGSAPVPPSTGLATDGNVAAYAAGNSVRVLDLTTAASKLVARTAGPAVGLSIDAGRLLWGERAAIRAAPVP